MTKAKASEKLVTTKSQITKNLLQCSQCLKILSSETHFQRHIRTHEPKDFTCDNCGRHFNTKDKLRLHLFNHRKHYKIKCTVCDKEYVTHQSMRKHLRTHFEQHQCDECGQVFKHKRLLQNHIQAVHKDEPTIPCKCEY
jgi:KRAB domain-containing zinc finger protein